MQTIVVTGGTGFLGTRVIKRLLQRGDRVIVLTRREGDPRVPRGAEVRVWQPEERGSWYEAIDGADAVLHLAGEPVIGGRWTPEKKRKIRDSRVVSTRRVVEAIGEAARRPRALVCASAVGYYGPRDPAEALDERSSSGEGFLADVVRAWEDAAEGATALGLRVVRLRIGIVLGAEGGALAQMLTPFRLFVGGTLGSGTQVLSWIHIDDAAALILLALDDERARGAINLTAPAPVTMDTFTRSLGQALSRPSIFAVPAFALRVAMGEAADTLLTGQRVLPRQAEQLGFSFRFPALGAAFADLFPPRGQPHAEDPG